MENNQPYGELSEHEMEMEQDTTPRLRLEVGLPTKANIDKAAYAIIKRVEDGELNPLEVAVKVAALEKALELIKQGIKPQVLTELSKEKDKAVILGANIQAKESAVKYSFEQTPLWSRLKEQETEVGTRRKELEEMLKKLPKKLIEVDEATGDTIEYFPASKTSTTTFAVTLGK